MINVGDYTIIKSIEEAIIKLIWDKFNGTLDPVPDVITESPVNVEVEEGSKHKLSVFLYRIEENGYMKNLPREEIGSSHLKRQPLYLDLYFMLTPYAPKEIDEHEILGRAMQILHDKSILKSTDAEVAGMVFAGLDEEIHITLFPITLDDQTKIWSALKEVPYKLSAYYKVTVAKIDSELSDEVKRVREKQTEYYMGKGEYGHEMV